MFAVVEKSVARALPGTRLVIEIRRRGFGRLRVGITTMPAMVGIQRSTGVGGVL